jgi:hypothetical protein
MPAGAESRAPTEMQGYSVAIPNTGDAIHARRRRITRAHGNAGLFNRPYRIQETLFMSTGAESRAPTKGRV